MNRVVYKSLPKVAGREPPAGVTERTVATDGAEPRVVRIVDGRKETFGTDLGWVFGRNVARAREENKRLTGKPEGTVVSG
jgi:hypothetical protein